jgi:hypothetical protein
MLERPYDRELQLSVPGELQMDGECSEAHTRKVVADEHSWIEVARDAVHETKLSRAPSQPPACWFPSEPGVCGPLLLLVLRQRQPGAARGARSSPR